MSKETQDTLDTFRVVENTNRPNEHTEVICKDEPGAGGMCHEYVVIKKTDPESDGVSPIFANIDFQMGPVKENGVNGCHHEDLIMVVLDRLRGAQKGEFSCRENALAITKLEEALLWLNYRTNSRVQRGVEGMSQK